MTLALPGDTSLVHPDYSLADAFLWDENPDGLPHQAEIVYPVVGFGEVMFNYYDQATGCEFICENLDGWAGLPAADPTLVTRQFDYGAWSGRGWYGPRILTLTGVLLAPTRAALQDGLHRLRAQHWDALTNTAVLAVAEVDAEKRLGVRTTTSTMNITYITATVLRAEIEMAAAWPVKRGLPRQDVAHAPGRSGGRHYNRPSVDGDFRVYGAIEPSGNLRLENRGNAPVRPQFLFTGASTNPAVWAMEQGKFLEFNIGLTAADRLFVDSDTHAVLQNDQASRRYALTPDSQWFDLLPGVNTIEYRPGSGGGSMTVFWSDGWW